MNERDFLALRNRRRFLSEAGCGVGAQTVILARNSPDAQFTSVDVSPASVKIRVMPHLRPTRPMVMTLSSLHRAGCDWPALHL